MLWLLMPTMQFRGKEADEFLKQHKGGEDLLDKYLVDPRNNTSTSNIEVSSLKYPYKDFSWFFSHMIGFGFMIVVPRNIIYIINFIVHENFIIYWGHIIFSEISFQLHNLKKTLKFYMTSYLIFVIDDFHVFRDFPRERSFDSNLELVFAWYPSLWRHKAHYYFFPVHNNFISKLKKIVFGPNMSILLLEATTFLLEKGIFETTKCFSIIRLTVF
jgi:hypothetical protein